MVTHSDRCGGLMHLIALTTARCSIASITSIAGSTVNKGQPGATTMVNYQYSFTAALGWAQPAGYRMGAAAEERSAGAGGERDADRYNKPVAGDNASAQQRAGYEHVCR
jgi:hypothetical protein